jgi:hypothetical protein
MLISHHCRSFDRISLFSRFFFSLPQSFMPFWYTVSMSIAVAGIPRPAKLLARLITVVTLSRRYPFHDFSNPAQPSSVQYGYICCGRVDNRSIECPVKSYQQTRSSGAEINSDALSILMTNCLMDLLYFHGQVEKSYLQTKGDMNNDRNRQQKPQEVQ